MWNLAHRTVQTNNLPRLTAARLKKYVLCVQHIIIIVDSMWVIVYKPITYRTRKHTFCGVNAVLSPIQLILTSSVLFCLLSSPLLALLPLPSPTAGVPVLFHSTYMLKPVNLLLSNIFTIGSLFTEVWPHEFTRKPGRYTLVASSPAEGDLANGPLYVAAVFKLWIPVLLKSHTITSCHLSFDLYLFLSPGLYTKRRFIGSMVSILIRSAHLSRPILIFWIIAMSCNKV